LSTPHSDHFLFSTKFLSPASISIILRRAVGASHGLSVKSSRIRGDDVNPSELRLLQIDVVPALLVCREPIAPVYASSLG